MRVLVTGAAGSIGAVLCSGLVDRGHTVVGLDRVPEPEGFTGDWFTADCADPDAVEAVFAAAGALDAVVHLAGIPSEASLPEELTSHVVTTAALLDAMVRHGVSRIVYASSNHAVGRTPRDELGTDLLGTAVRPRPDTFYGVSKVAAEALLSLYVDRYGIDAVATRIGSFLPQPESVRGLSTWLSHDDAVRMVEASPHRARPRLRGALRRLREHPRLVGPRPRAGARLRPAGRRRAVRRRGARRPTGTTRRPRTWAVRSPPGSSSGRRWTEPVPGPDGGLNHGWTASCAGSRMRTSTTGDRRTGAP